MAKKTVNKNAQNNFLKLEVSEQIQLLNNVLEKGTTTESISELGFSYSWVLPKMQEQGVYYVSSLKKFIIEEKGGNFSDKEITELRAIIKDYNEFRNKKDNVDVRLCAGSCGEETVTKSIVIDKEVNDRWNDFSKKNAFINSKDLYTKALKEFLDRYI